MKAIFLYFLLLLVNCVYVHKTESINVWSVDQSEKVKYYKNHENVFELHAGGSKCIYISKDHVPDSILMLYPKLLNCFPHQIFIDFFNSTWDGYSNPDFYSFHSLDSSILIIDSVKAIYENNNICFGRGEMFVRIFNDGKCNILIQSDKYKVKANISISNGQIVDIDGAQTHTYTRKRFRYRSASKNSFSKYDYRNWVAIAEEKCQKIENE